MATLTAAQRRMVLKLFERAPARGITPTTLRTALGVSEKLLKSWLQILFDQGVLDFGEHVPGQMRRWRLRDARRA